MYLFPVVQFNIGYAFTILRSIASMESSSATVLLASYDYRLYL